MTNYLGADPFLMLAPNGERGDSWDWDDPWHGRGRYWLRADRVWYRDERKDEDPRHPIQWNDGWRDCDRCGTSVYDRATLGKDEVICDGERRKVERWQP